MSRNSHRIEIGAFDGDQQVRDIFLASCEILADEAARKWIGNIDQIVSLTAQRAPPRSYPRQSTFLRLPSPEYRRTRDQCVTLAGNFRACATQS